MKNKVAHKRVASVCAELARTVYENMAQDNDFHAYIKQIDQAIADQEIETTLTGADLFARALAPQLRPVAIRLLAKMLEDDSIDEATKAEIFDAIMMDKWIPENAKLN